MVIYNKTLGLTVNYYIALPATLESGTEKKTKMLAKIRQNSKLMLRFFCFFFAKGE